MIINLLPEAPVFPDVSQADADGLVGISLDFSIERILAAYRAGIFPWFQEQDFYFWYSPDPRMVLYLDDVVVQKSMRPYINQNKFVLSMDTCFEQVMWHCAQTPRAGQEDTWIGAEFIQQYTKLHEMGIAHSVEVWQEDTLVGGFYGLSLGQVFFGESMFSTVPNASKYALIFACRWMHKKGIKLIDCQTYTPHLASMGAVEMPRQQFIAKITDLTQLQYQPEKWHYTSEN